MSAPRVWPVLVAYLLAFVSIVSFSLVAALLLRAEFPELSEREVFDGLPGILASATASAAALVVTLLIVARPVDPVRLRLLPGRETGAQLGAMIVGTLALGQALDSATGPDLFAAVVVIGVLAGSAEEMFFRGYMQGRLRERFTPAVAVVMTSVAFSLLHLEWIHAGMALVLGLWLGFVTEQAGSALPAVAAHVINNALFTLLTALLGNIDDRALNMMLLAAASVIFVGCAFWVRRLSSAPPPSVKPG